jgi:UTP--glucose-1-phosphate uridylyltransferase
VPSYASCIFIRQPAPLGLGHAVLCSRPAVGDEPFFIHLADDLIDANPPCLAQMAKVFSGTRSSVLGVETVSADETHKYGIVAIQATAGRIARVERIVEKPQPAEAPSNLAVIGRYVLTPRIFELLAAVTPGTGGEIQLTDGMAKLIGEQPFHALTVDAVRYDCGDKAGYVLANLAIALGRDDLRPAIEEFLGRR